MNGKSLAVMLALSGAPGVWARSVEEPEVLVRLIDGASVPPTMLIPAKETARRILASAGVRVRWGRAGCESGEATDVVDLLFKYSTPVAHSPGALAEALPFARSGIRVTVFFDRFLVSLSNRRLSAGAMLGHVLAHEIGHVLLGVKSHAETGLMKARWTALDLSGLPVKHLEFTAADARLIRANLAIRTSFEQIHDHFP